MRCGCGSTEEWVHKRNACEDDGKAWLQATEDVGFWNGIGDIREIHAGQDGDAEGADNARAAPVRSEMVTGAQFNSQGTQAEDSNECHSLVRRHLQLIQRAHGQKKYHDVGDQVEDSGDRK